MELNSKTNEGLENGQDHTSEFKEIVEESRATVHSEMLDKPPSKRGRGRPRKSDSKEAPKARPAAGQAGTEAAASAGNVSEPTPDISQHLVGPIIFISKIPARKYGIAELAFQPDEAYFCAQSLNNCLQVFAPSLNQMSPKTAAILGVCSAFGTVAFTKYQIYLEKRPPQEPEPEVQEKIADEQAKAKVSADGYFRKSN